VVPVVDLNADLGESFGVWKLGDDDAMLRVVTSANVACGFHAGDPSTLRAACAGAVANGVAIGAQVSYPDLVGFGRRFLDMDPRELRDAVLYQLGALDAFARAAGGRVAYVKPHGALYHAAAADGDQARAVVEAAHEYDPSLAVLGRPGSALLDAADARGLANVGEAFADRAYLPDGTLAPRSHAGSVLVDPATVARRAVDIAVTGNVRAVDGSAIRVEARSICVHGDTPGAVRLVEAVRDALEASGVGIRAFVP
jgi:UPF0271 protein